jgi:Heparinase II/III-like protein/Alginate lyase
MRRTAELDWSALRLRAQTLPWAIDIADRLSQAFDHATQVLPKEPPLGESAWYHHYFCDADATKLLFDPKQPSRHVCKTCGKEYTGKPWDDSWRLMVHGSIIGNCERALVLGRLRPEEKKYADYFRRTMLFYAQNYHLYPARKGRVGQTKIMASMLDEAVAIASMGRLMQWAKSTTWFNLDELDTIRQKLFKPAIELLKPQVTDIHNIHEWMMSAVAACGAMLGDTDLVRWTLDSPFGFHQQLKHGVNADGLWWEGSMTYHLYTFEALASHALAALDAGIDVFDTPRFASMLAAPLELVYPNGIFPAHNDCWPAVRLAPHAYEFGAWAWPQNHFDRNLGWITRLAGNAKSVERWTQTVDQIDTPPARSRSSVHALLWGPDQIEIDSPLPERKSRLLPASGIAILEHPSMDLRVCVRSTPDGKSHDHCDKTGVDVFANGHVLSADLGTSGYGAKITPQWLQTAAAHNLVVVDGAKQAAINGKIQHLDAQSVVALAPEIQPGVSLRRTIRMTNTGWTDRVEVLAERDVRADYFFHASGALSLNHDLQPDSIGEGHGYAWLRHVQSTSSQHIVATWTGQTGQLRATMVPSVPTTAFTALSDENPASPDRQLGVLALRRNGKGIVFEIEFEWTPQ